MPFPDPIGSLPSQAITHLSTQPGARSLMMTRRVQQGIHKAVYAMMLYMKSTNNILQGDTVRRWRLKTLYHGTDFALSKSDYFR